jgi:hypothetical protein
MHHEEKTLNLLELDLESSFECVKTESDLVRFFSKVKALHDSVLKQVNWTTENEVRQDLRVYYGHKDVLQVVFHSQYESSPFVEIIAVKVELLNIRPEWEIQATGEIKDGRIIISFGGNAFVSPGVPAFGFACQSLYYRIHDKASLPTTVSAS